ncbi:40S ribosomal protein S27 [Cryptococcus deuterogattii 99/473]|uniref:40S ribosomal protein S27 n=1 Tax=Cryptococcus deuterogattii Ram5 TaxID=1296110 RepID=A0A0D0V5R5_9TREE|nr:40S ribosomal protein S27 [Cryptococcus deuterogattii Ram5]KIY59927.1 40S ribosomal protein S27 [Cryptococcus deuterogattii 99/473]
MVSRVPSTVAWTHTTVVASPGSVEMIGSEIGIRREGMERNGRKKLGRGYVGVRKIGGTLVEDFGGEDCGRAVTGWESFSPRRLLTGSSIHPSALAVLLYHLSIHRTATVLAIDLINRPASTQARTHKLKKIVPEPNSFFMDVKCPGCFAITTVFSHASTVVQCQGCATALCQPTGGKAKLTEGCSFRRKN